jgi:hypothetical protein
MEGFIMSFYDDIPSALTDFLGHRDERLLACQVLKMWQEFMDNGYPGWRYLPLEDIKVRVFNDPEAIVFLDEMEIPQQKLTNLVEHVCAATRGEITLERDDAATLLDYSGAMYPGSVGAVLNAIAYTIRHPDQAIICEKQSALSSVASNLPISRGLPA